MTNEDREDPTFIDQSTYENSLKARRVTSVGNFPLNVELGLIDGVEYRGSFGTSDVGEGIANEQVLGDGMTGRYPFPSSAAQMTIVSSSANDTAAGTGARVLLVRGNDSDNVDSFEVLLLDGTDPITTVNSYLRINSVVVVSVGSSKKNEGNITVKNGADLLAQVSIGISQSRTSVYSIPAGKIGLVYYYNILTGKDDNATVLSHLFPTAAPDVDITIFEHKSYVNSVAVTPSGFSVSEGEDIEFTAYSQTGSGDSNVSILFQMYISEVPS